MHHAPVFDFEIHKDSKTSVKRHIKLSNDHHQCFEAKFYHSELDRRMQELLKSGRMKVNEMTCNVIRVVYFLLKYDLSALMFENISNLLVTVNALIGNQLHSRKTAVAIAFAIDEVYMKLINSVPRFRRMQVFRDGIRRVDGQRDRKIPALQDQVH